MREVRPEDVAFFINQLGIGCERADARRKKDWLGKFGNDASTVTYVVFPENTRHVSRIVAHCYAEGIAITPQGGNTGLVGGSVPLSSELILSLERLTAIESFDDFSGVLVCEAGATLSSLNEYLFEYGYIVPLDLGPRDLVQIGGAVATNAGGLRFARYGSLHGNILGLEVVLADQEGTVLDLGLSTALQKDNTGYDLKQLFIGSEGTLGVVTRCAIKCAVNHKSIQLAVITCRSFAQVLDVLRLAKVELGEILSAFEYLDHQSLALAGTIVDRLLIERIFDLAEVDEGQCFCIVETRGSNEEHDRAKAAKFLESIDCQGAKMVLDDERALVWQVRTSVSAGLRKYGTTFKYDISLPIRDMDDMVVATKKRLDDSKAPEGTITCGFGHIMDGNVHLNVAIADADDAKMESVDIVKAVLEPWVYEEVTRRKGSISAEHGVGTMKAGAFATTKDVRVVNKMRDLKCLLDDRHIMNPNKIFHIS